MGFQHMTPEQHKAASDKGLKAQADKGFVPAREERTHCRRGHELSGYNVMFVTIQRHSKSIGDYTDEVLRCRICHYERMAKARVRQRRRKMDSTNNA